LNFQFQKVNLHQGYYLGFISVITVYAMKMDFDEIIGATSYFVLFEIMKVTLMVDFELFDDG
jgi:hypothetical protein